MFRLRERVARKYFDKYCVLLRFIIKVSLSFSLFLPTSRCAANVHDTVSYRSNFSWRAAHDQCVHACVRACVHYINQIEQRIFLYLAHYIDSNKLAMRKIYNKFERAVRRACVLQLVNKTARKNILGIII